MLFTFYILSVFLEKWAINIEYMILLLVMSFQNHLTYASREPMLFTLFSF